MTEIFISTKFKKSLKRIPIEIVEIFATKQSLFAVNPFHSSLRTHKLTGKLNMYFAFSITNSYRVIFEFLNKNKIVFINIGTHEIYKK